MAKALGNKCTPAKMSRILVRQPHTVSAIIDRMVKNGFLKKVKDMERKNWVRVIVTEKGEKAAAIAKEGRSDTPGTGGLKPERTSSIP